MKAGPGSSRLKAIRLKSMSTTNPGAIDRNFASFQKAVASVVPSVHFMDNGIVQRLVTDINVSMFNGIVSATIPHGFEESAVREQVEFFTQERRPWRWTVGPSSSPSNLGSFLENQGLEVAVDCPGMVLEMSDRPRAWPQPGNGSVKVVEDTGALLEWCEFVQSIFGVPLAFIEQFKAYHAVVGFTPASRTYYVTGVEQGKPVSASMVYLDPDDIAGVYCVGTLAESRRQGWGSALVGLCLQEAYDQGCRAAVLTTTDIGQGVYESLGFHEVCRVRHYRFSEPN